MYNLLRRVLFLFPPEDVHYFSMNCLAAARLIPGFRSVISSHITQHPQLTRNVFNLTFKNPVGLGAGFDKNALYLSELDMLGFGSIEIGTVTPRPQSGNEKPRLFRLPEHKAIINRMGFNNDGVKPVVKRLSVWRTAHKRSTLIVGGNIGKNKLTPNEDAWKDYEHCFRELFEFVDYFVVNVSSPNTPGLRELQEKESLNKILSHLQTINQQRSVAKPLLLKIAPDLTNSQLDDVIDLALETGLSGIVATNTTTARDNLPDVSSERLQSIGAGGLSGEPLKERSTEVVKYINQRSGGKMPIIASGGIFTASDAIEKMNAGASLVQVWTGFIYEGPRIVKNICEGLVWRFNQS